MVKIFNISGYITIFCALIQLFIVGPYNALVAILTTFLTVILGMAFISISRLLERVEFLELHLEVSYEGHYLEDDSLPQKQCPKCGKMHDFDYPSCPHCKYKYDVEV